MEGIFFLLISLYNKGMVYSCPSTPISIFVTIRRVVFAIFMLLTTLSLGAYAHAVRRIRRSLAPKGIIG